MSVTPANLAALVVAISFAAGLNVYATILTLGGMARLHWVDLPPGLDGLSSWWVIGASAVLFGAEFVADKIPGFDLVWNAAHTFVRVPLALLLAYGATTHLTPEMRILVTILGGAIAAVTHGSKLAVRGAVTASPEPFSNAVLSTTEDAVAVGITWTATHHPLIAGSIAAVAVVVALLMARMAVRAIRRLWIRLTQRPQAAAVILLLLVTVCAHAQMLARPGWNGAGVAAQAWSKHAVIYEIDTRSFADSNGDGVGDLKGITQHLDYLQTLGVDAILLDSLLPPAGEAAKLATPIDPALGTVDDFDDLSLQASRHNIRILLDLPDAHAGLARFWLTQGIAGFHISSGEANPAGLQAIRKQLNTSSGQRMLITDDVAGGKPAPNELYLDTAMLKLSASSGASVAAQLRGAMEELQKSRAGNLIVASDTTGLPRSVNRLGDGSSSTAVAEGLARIAGTVLLLNRSAALLYAGQELALPSPGGKGVMVPWGPPPVAAAPPPAPPKPVEPAYPGQYVPYVPPPTPARAIPPDPASAAGQALNQGSVLNFYRHLIELHRGNGPLRDGDEVILNHDDQNALVWVRRPARPTYQNPAVFVVCNLSDKPLTISLKADIERLHLHGTFLRTVLRSDDGLGSMPVDPITVPGFGVYVGELKF